MNKTSLGRSAAAANLVLALAIGWMLTVVPASAQPRSNSSLIVSTDRYEFYSNFWINMHHFFYQKAVQSQEREWREVFDEQLLKQMNGDDREILKDALQYYKDHLIEHSLLFNKQLFWTKRVLIRLEMADVLDHEAIEPEHQQVLNAAKALYEKYFWEAHHDQNTQTVEENLPLIRKFENRAIERIAGLARQSWPEGKVRIDVSRYSNWAGAYTTVTPIVHAVISSQSGSSAGERPEYGWLELLFHEPSHAVISPNHYAIANSIEKVSEELDVEVPENLWHALLFYFSGEVVRELLQEEGVEYELLMVTNDIFSSYHATVFEHMPQYTRGDASLEVALKKVIAGLND